MIIKLQDVWPLRGLFIPNAYFATCLKSVVDNEEQFEATKTIIPPAAFWNNTYLLVINNIQYRNTSSYDNKGAFSVEHCLTDGITSINIDYKHERQFQYLEAVASRQKADDLLTKEGLDSIVDHEERRQDVQSRDKTLAIEQQLYAENARRSANDSKKFLLSGDRLHFALMHVTQHDAQLVLWKPMEQRRGKPRRLLENPLPAYET